jgi:leucyl-tRNA synthetase
VLHDLGLVSTREPFKKLFNQGMIGGEDGQKMSKSRGNVVNPDDVVEKFGADSFRIYEMFMGPLDKSKPWNTKGLQGSYKFIQKVWRVYIENKDKINNVDNASDETLRILHQTIKKVTEDLETLSFNTAVSQMMIFINHFLTLKSYNEDVLKSFLIILNPFAPHVTEEINEVLFSIENGQISSFNWPKYDESLMVTESMTIAVQINGKTRGTVDVGTGTNKDDIIKIISENNNFKKYLINVDIIKEVYVPNRLVNLVVK